MSGENFPSRIEGVIEADEVHIGVGAVVEAGAVIRGKSGPAQRVIIGDFAYIGANVKVMCPEFVIGDYTKLHENAFCHGEKPLRIGRNCWFGGGVILDSMGGLDIDDNVGIGAGSQIWTHAQFGDIVEGSRFYSNKYMHIGKDAWLVGQCLVSPVRIEPRSMAMLGSVVTRDMLENRIYAGTPAKDLSDKIGFQFEDRSIDQKVSRLKELIDDFEVALPAFAGQLLAVDSLPGSPSREVTYFDLSNRTYTRRTSEAEVAFLKRYVPLIKFSPYNEPPFYTSSTSAAGT